MSGFGAAGAYYHAIATSAQKGGNSLFPAYGDDNFSDPLVRPDRGQDELQEQELFVEDVSGELEEQEEPEEEVGPVNPVDPGLSSVGSSFFFPNAVEIPQTIPKPRYSAHDLIQVSDMDFSKITMPTATVEDDVEEEEQEEEIEPTEYTPVKKSVPPPSDTFATTFPNFSLPGIMTALPCELYVAINPPPVVDVGVGDMRKYQANFSKMITKELDDHDVFCASTLREYISVANALHNKILEGIDKEAQEQIDLVKIAVGDKYPCAIGETLVGEKLEKHDRELKEKTKVFTDQRQAKLDLLWKSNRESSKALITAHETYKRKVQKRILRCERRVKLIYEGIRERNAKEQSDKKFKKNVENFKNFLTPLENRYLRVEPRVVAPVRRLLFSYNSNTGTHRLVEIYHWFDMRKLFGVFILMVSLLYASGYLEKWFITPYNMFSQERQEYLDANGRLISNTLLRFGMMDSEVHSKQISWISSLKESAVISERDVSRGYVTIPWSDGLNVNISILLLEQRLASVYSSLGKGCLCAAHVGVPVNVAFMSDTMMIEPSFSTETKIKYQSGAADVFSKTYPAIEYPSAATTVFRDSAALQRRLETERSGNRCIVRCSQIIARKK